MTELYGDRVSGSICKVHFVTLCLCIAQPLCFITLLFINSNEPRTSWPHPAFINRQTEEEDKYFHQSFFFITYRIAKWETWLLIWTLSSVINILLILFWTKKLEHVLIDETSLMVPLIWHFFLLKETEWMKNLLLPAFQALSTAMDSKYNIM